jgi:glycosyltransferase involved in cell wall biosynthesis
MRIAVATIGRFHVLDLARELSALGNEVAFWSIVPQSRAERFGLPAETHRNLLSRLFPLVAAHRYGGQRLRKWANSALLHATDRLVARRLEPCDVFIGMSGLCVESARVARERYGAKVLIERGSRHVLSQKAILDCLVQRGFPVDTVPEYIIERELDGYAIADRIVIPSHHVAQSFMEQGVPVEKLFRNAYGADLSMFQPTLALTDRPPTILFVGTWSYRKGVDLLVTAWRRLKGVKLLHVGAAGDAPLPDMEGFEHVNPVPQWRLREYYARAHLFVLASREEGLSLVQVQALACGLPVICTDRTGGEDLQEKLFDKERVTVVPHDSADALVDGIRKGLARAARMNGIRDGLGAARNRFTWRAYAERYHEFLNGTCRSKQL